MREVEQSILKNLISIMRQVNIMLKYIIQIKHKKFVKLHSEYLAIQV